MDFKSLHFQSVACPRMRTLVLQTMDFQSIVVDPGDETHAHGVTLPDFPGCFSAADRWEDIPAKIQEAVELWFAGESLEVLVSTSLDRPRDDPQYTDGEWILLDIDQNGS